MLKQCLLCYIENYYICVQINFDKMAKYILSTLFFNTIYRSDTCLCCIGYRTGISGVTKYRNNNICQWLKNSCDGS